MQKLLSLAAGLLIASSAMAQMPVPAFSSTFTSTLTRGFFFQAPVGFFITGLQVYNEAAQPNQVVEVIDFGTTQPPAYPGTVIGTSLFYDNTSPSNTVIPCSVTCAPGNWYGILGACTASQGNSTSYNSYAVPGPYTSDILGNPVQIARMGTQIGLAASGPNQPCWTEVAGSIARVDVYVASNPGGGFATKVPFGEGCYRSFGSFYENNSAFDMSNTSLEMINLGNSYLVQQGTATWHTPTSTPVTLGDDVVQQFSLGWTLPYPGGTTTDLWISSNGFINGIANANSGCCSFNLAQFLSSGPCWSAFWRDLYPPGGGTVTFDTDPVNGDAYITFDNVPNCCGSTPVSSFQYQFHSTGIVSYVYGNCAVTNAGVGWSPGIASQDPGSIDLSALTVLVTGADRVPLSLAGSARPVVGTSVTLTVGNVPATTLLGAVIYGLTKHDPGINLTAFGMPDCYQFCSQDAVSLLLSSPYQSNFAVPNSAGLAGVHIITQGAVYDPSGGHNAIGALTSNGIDLGININ